MTHYRLVPPRDPAADQVCLLTREWAARRQEPVDALLSDASAELPLPNGIEYRFNAQPGIWERLDTFIEEEADCCPFLGFEVFEHEGEAVLRVLQREATE